jgi:hypothetical protein
MVDMVGPMRVMLVLVMLGAFPRLDLDGAAGQLVDGLQELFGRVMVRFGYRVGYSADRSVRQYFNA